MSVELLSPLPTAARIATASPRPDRGFVDVPLQAMHRVADALGMPLMCVDSQTGTIVCQSDWKLLPWIPRDLCNVQRFNSIQVHTHSSGLIHFCLPLPQEEPGDRFYLAVGYALAMPGLRPHELEQAAADAGWSEHQFDDWLSRVPFCQEEMLRRHLMLGMQNVRNQELCRHQEELLLGFVRSLVSSLDAKDPYTRGHSERVAMIARRIGLEMKLPEADLRDIYLSGLLHDIGKIGLDDQILRKAGALTPEEFEQVKKHPVIGYNILVGLKNLQAVIPGVRHHHEAWGGNGYPDNLAGEQIPLMARIMSVADAYDAMGSDRPYRKGMPVARVEEVLRNGSGQQWDPRVVAAFFACRREIYEFCQKHQKANSAVLADVDEYLQPPSTGRGVEDRIRDTLNALAALPSLPARADAP